MVDIILVTTVYNRRHLVGQALQSAVNQTLHKNKWAHLVIDNASTDGADKIIDKFTNTYNNIYSVKMDTNVGQMPAYNYALTEWIPKNFPNAKIMAQLDSDDMLANNALSKVLEMFNQYPHIGMTYSNFNIIGPAPKNKLKHKNHPKAKQAPEQFTYKGQQTLRRMQVKGNIIGHLRALSIPCLNKIGGFDETYKYSTDFNMACKMLESFLVVKIGGSALYHWREHGDQVQGHHSPEQTKHWQMMQKYYLKRWKKMGII